MPSLRAVSAVRSAAALGVGTGGDAVGVGEKRIGAVGEGGPQQRRTALDVAGLEGRARGQGRTDGVDVAAVGGLQQGLVGGGERAGGHGGAPRRGGGLRDGPSLPSRALGGVGGAVAPVGRNG
ncbi:hypothetical protein ACGF13_18805 [Kitasatospora sp. NPDC048286]|uniref:hypothetical protein n=1 Tax=Kitasatospora sp. NPDC048286 TaxID=3364047 RepID=UPI00371763DA